MIQYIHVGDYKTGTSWLQRFGYLYHPEINYLGDPNLPPALEKALRHLTDLRDLDYNEDMLREELSEWDKEAKLSLNKINLVSREVLCCSDYISGESALRNAQRLKSLFGNVKIIYVIREQISMLSSIYSQYVKMGGTLNIKDFLVDPIESAGLYERLKYHKQIEMYKKVFGEKEVFIGLYEEFKQNLPEFLTKLYGFIGCKDSSYLPEEMEVYINPSLTTIGATICRFTNHFFRSERHNSTSPPLRLDKIIAKVLTKKKKKEILEQSTILTIPNFYETDDYGKLLYAINMRVIWKAANLVTRIRLGGPPGVPKQLVPSLLDRFKSSNRILIEKHGIPIDTYGWTY